MAVLLVIHLIIALAIIISVLIQPSEAGGFLGSSGSMSNLMAPKRTMDGMTKFTTILAGLFFVTSLLLAIAAGHRPVQKSILDAAPQAEAPAAPVTSAPPAAPAIPEAPSTPKAPTQ